MTALEFDARVTTASSHPRPPAVVLDGVSKRHGKGAASVLALDGVHLTVEQG